MVGQMPETCNRRKCEHERYGNSKKCIFHCDKSDFNAADITIFWEKLRAEYIASNHYGQLIQDIIIEDMIFPKFENYSAYSKNNFFKSSHYQHFDKSVKFEKCMFLDDFNLLHTASTQQITFDNCTFHGSIILARSSTMVIENSIFKNEVSMGNNQWNTVELKGVKFSKQATINVQVQLRLQDCTFNDAVSIQGFNNLTAKIENGTYKKSVNLNNILDTTIACLNQEEYLELRDDVIFNSCDNIFLHNVNFHKQSHIGENEHYEITIDNTILNDVVLNSGGALKVINQSKINGQLEIKKGYKNLNIEDSYIGKETNIKNVKNVNLKNSSFVEKASFINEYIDFPTKDERDWNIVSIKDNCAFKELVIDTAHILNIDNVTIENNLDLLGEFTELELNGIKPFSQEQLRFNDTLELKYPSLKVSGREFKYPEISIKESEFNDVEISSLKILNIQNTFIEGSFDLEGGEDSNLTVDKVRLKNRCNFPNVNALVLKQSSFEKEVDFNVLGSLVANDTQFNEDVKFLADCTTVQLEKCEFKEMMKLTKVTNVLDLKYCHFKDDVDLSNGEFNIVNILSSNFEGRLLLTSSIIRDKINLDAITGESYRNNSFDALVDFQEASIRNINIVHSNFYGELNFNAIKDSIVLPNFTKSTINHLMIINSVVFELFRNSTELRIDKFTLANSKLDTKNESNEIEISGITIDVFKCNKVSFLKNMNLDKLKIEKFTIDDSNIEHTLRIKYSDIDIFTIESSIFEDLQIIDNKSKKIEKNKELILQNTTIKNTVLDKLKYYRFEMTDAHISDAKIGRIEFQEGSRETNRFLKNYYDSISDYITANEYYKQEMEEQLKSPLTKRGEKFVLWIGKKVSDFGQSWTRPFWLMIGFSIFFFTYMHWQTFYSYGWNYIWCNKGTVWNQFWEFLNPFMKTVESQYKGHYAVWMIHKILMTIFIYHFVVAVKRKTKR